MMYRLYFLLLSLVILSGCGGGGGSDTNNADSTNVGSDEETQQAEPFDWDNAEPFGNKVIVLSDNTSADYQEIYSVDPDTEEHFLLSSEMPRGGKFARIIISPDGKKVAYTADQDLTNVYEVYVSDSQGQRNIKVSKDLTRFTPINFYWSSDSASLRIVVSSNESDNYHVDLNGQEVAAPQTPERDFSSIPHYDNALYSALRDDVLVIVYFDVLASSNRVQIYDVESTPTLLGSVLIDDFDVDFIWWTPQVNNFMLVGDYGSSTSEAVLLFNVNSSALSTIYEGTVLNRTTDVFSDTKSKHAYWALNDNKDQYDLFVLDIDTALTEKTSASVSATTTIYVMDKFRWLANGDRLLWAVASNTDAQKDLYSYNPSTKLISNLTASPSIGQEYQEHILSPDEDKIAIMTESDDRYSDVYISSIDGSDIEFISPNLGIQNRIRHWAWSPDGDGLALRHYEFDPALEFGRGYKVSHYSLTTSTVTNLEAHPSDSREALCILVYQSKNSCIFFYDTR